MNTGQRSRVVGISIRIAESLLRDIDAEAARDRRSRNAKIVEALEDWISSLGNGRSGSSVVTPVRPSEKKVEVVPGSEKTAVAGVDLKSAEVVRKKPAAEDSDRKSIGSRPSHCNEPMLDFTTKWKCAKCPHTKLK